MIVHMGENGKIRVLIAEDDPIQRKLLHDALEMERDIVCFAARSRTFF